MWTAIRLETAAVPMGLVFHAIIVQITLTSSPWFNVCFWAP